MPRVEWRVALRAIAGFLAGLALWAAFSPQYNRGIAAVAEKVLRAFERPAVTQLKPAKDGFITIDRSDFDPRSKRPGVPLHDLTLNVLLVTALFAASKRPFSDRNIGGFFVAMAVLALTHVLAAVTEVMSIYVGKLGLWSTMHYGKFTANFWGVASHFYRLVLMYAIAFALWWIFRDPAAEAPAGDGKKKRRR